MPTRVCYIHRPTRVATQTMSAPDPVNSAPPSDNVAANPVQQQTAQAIHSIMFGGAFDSAAWRQVESFASGKAREMRTEKLKRGSQDVSAGGEFGAQLASAQPRRKILKVKRRK